MKNLLIDTSVWLSIFDEKDPNHHNSYRFYMYHKEICKIYISPLTHFEYESWKSRIYRRKNMKKEPLREWYIDNWNIIKYNITHKLSEDSYKLDLFNKFTKLKWADLIHACIAKTEDLILVTNDNDFLEIKDNLYIIFPKDFELTKEMFNSIKS